MRPIRAAALAFGLTLAAAVSGCATSGIDTTADTGPADGLSDGPRGSGNWAWSARFCDQPPVHNARQQDRMLRFAAVVREELDRTGEDVALISRSGTDLSRIGIRFTHSGITLREGTDVPWSVRQLYYACDEGRPRLFDQGVAGFLSGAEDPRIGFVSIVLLPDHAAARLQRTALDKSRALRLLAARYSANAYPFSTRYQNCNQWVMELLATAWGDLPDGDDLRERAQAWLAEHHYQPTPVDLDSHLLKFAAGFMPLVHLDDHPADDRAGLRFQVSLPETIEHYVSQQLPEARRIELCHEGSRIVVRQGWRPIAADCQAEPGDRVVRLD